MEQSVSFVAVNSAGFKLANSRRFVLIASLLLCTNLFALEETDGFGSSRSSEDYHQYGFMVDDQYKKTATTGDPYTNHVIVLKKSNFVSWDFSTVKRVANEDLVASDGDEFPAEMFPMRPYHPILHDYIDQVFEEKTGFDDRAINDVFFKADDTRFEHTWDAIDRLMTPNPFELGPLTGSTAHIIARRDDKRSKKSHKDREKGNNKKSKKSDKSNKSNKK